MLHSKASYNFLVFNLLYNMILDPPLHSVAGARKCLLEDEIEAESQLQITEKCKLTNVARGSGSTVAAFMKEHTQSSGKLKAN